MAIFSHRFGGEPLLAYGVGIAYGSIISTIAMWGWGSIGAALVAPVEEKKRLEILWCSNKMVFLITAVLLPFFLILLIHSAPVQGKLVAILAFFTPIVLSFIPKWWFIATNRPAHLMKFIVAPQVAGNVAAIVLMIVDNSPIYFPLCLLIANTISVIYFFTSRKVWAYKSELKVLPRLKEQFHAFLIGAGAMLYTRTMLPIVTLVSTSVAVSFNQGIQLYSYWLLSVQVMGSSFQSFVNRDGKKSVEGTHKLTVLCLLIFGLVFGSALWLLGPFFSKLVFGSSFANTSIDFFLLGLTFLAICMVTAFISLYLNPLGYAYASSRATIVSGIIGVISIYLLTKYFGLHGAYVAFFGGEGIVAFLAIIYSIRYKKGKLKMPVMNMKL
ncbi:MAG: hypothetical protein QM613_01405 [Micrococcaceae bacterium]